MIKEAKYNPKNSALKIKLPVRSPLEDYECWYFESILDNGNQIRVSYRINETYGLPIIYGVHAELIEKGNVKVISESFSGDEVEFSTEKCDHKLGNNWLLDLGDHFGIHVEIDRTVIDLKFYPEIYGFNNRRDGFINQNISGTKFIGWNIPVPKAKVSGSITTNEKVINVKGIGYHDHIWGNSLRDSEIKQLCWGKIFDTDLSLYYILLVENDQSVLCKLMVADKNGILLKAEDSPYNKTLIVNIQDYFQDKTTGIKIPNKISISHLSGVNIKLNIVLKEVFYQQEPGKHRLGGKSFLRFLGDESYKIQIEGKEFIRGTNSLHEVLIF